MGYPTAGTPGDSVSSPSPSPLGAEGGVDELTRKCRAQMEIPANRRNEYSSTRFGNDAVLDTKELREEVATRYQNSGQQIDGYNVCTLQNGTNRGELRVMKEGATVKMTHALFNIIKR